MPTLKYLEPTQKRAPVAEDPVGKNDAVVIRGLVEQIPPRNFQDPLLEQVITWEIYVVIRVMLMIRVPGWRPSHSPLCHIRQAVAELHSLTA